MKDKILLLIKHKAKILSVTGLMLAILLIASAFQTGLTKLEFDMANSFCEESGGLFSVKLGFGEIGVICKERLGMEMVCLEKTARKKQFYMADTPLGCALGGTFFASAEKTATDKNGDKKD